MACFYHCWYITLTLFSLLFALSSFSSLYCLSWFFFFSSVFVFFLLLLISIHSLSPFDVITQLVFFDTFDPPSGLPPHLFLFYFTGIILSQGNGRTCGHFGNWNGGIKHVPYYEDQENARQKGRSIRYRCKQATKRMLEQFVRGGELLWARTVAVDDNISYLRCILLH